MISAAASQDLSCFVIALSLSFRLPVPLKAGFVTILFHRSRGYRNCHCYFLQYVEAGTYTTCSSALSTTESVSDFFVRSFMKFRQKTELSLANCLQRRRERHLSWDIDLLAKPFLSFLLSNRKSYKLFMNSRFDERKASGVSTDLVPFNGAEIEICRNETSITLTWNLWAYLL